jgi:hypothetical protein
VYTHRRQFAKNRVRVAKEGLRIGDDEAEGEQL